MMTTPRPMLRPLFAALCAAATLAAVPCAARAAVPPYTAPVPVERVLDDGLRVVVFEDHRLPIVQVQLLVPAGVTAEPEDQSGIANFTAQMLDRGTPSRNAVIFATQMNDLGATLSTTALRDYTLIYAGFLAADLARGLDLFADAVTHPALSGEEFGRVRWDVARTLLGLHQNVVSTAEEQIWPLAMDGLPYAHPPAGSVPSVLNLTPEQVKEFHSRFYRPKGSTLAFAGDVTIDAAIEAARKAFGSWRGTAVEVPSTSMPPGGARARVRIIDVPSGLRTELRLAALAPEHGSRGYLPMRIADRVLGDGPGSSLANARLPGVAGSPRSSYTELRDAGLLTVRATARTDSAGPAVGALRDAIAAFRASPPAPAEVADARQASIASYPMAFETLGGLLATWAAADFDGLGGDVMSGYRAGLDTLTAAGVAATVKRWLDPARFVILAVGPADRLRPQLSAFGDVEVRKLEGVPEASWATSTPSADDFIRGKELVTAAAKAHGGLAALRGVHNFSILSEVVARIEDRELRGRFRQDRQDPDKYRELSEYFVFRSEHVMNAHDGWVYESREGNSRTADSLEMASMRENLIADPIHLLRLAAADSMRAALRGKELVDGHPVDVIEVTGPQGDAGRWLLLDANTHRLAAVDIRGGVPPQILARRIYSDYRDVSGLMVPFMEERYIENKLVMRIAVKEYQINAGIDRKTFTNPELK